MKVNKGIFIRIAIISIIISFSVYRACKSSPGPLDNFIFENVLIVEYQLKEGRIFDGKIDGKSYWGVFHRNDQNLFSARLKTEIYFKNKSTVVDSERTVISGQILNKFWTALKKTQTDLYKSTDSVSEYLSLQNLNLKIENIYFNFKNDQKVYVMKNSPLRIDININGVAFRLTKSSSIGMINDSNLFLNAFFN